MLSEFALSPAVFRTASYNENEALAEACLRALIEPFRDDCIVRDLWSGEWHNELSKSSGSFHRMGREFLKNLKKNSRLVSHASVALIRPCSDEEWETEALESHVKTPLAGMIFCQGSKAKRHLKNPLVACPEKLPSADFWKERPCSLRISRSINLYCDLLLPLLRHAPGVAFMDPHLDPSQGRYKDFIRLLTNSALTARNFKPTIEVHRVAWLGDSQCKLPNVTKIEEIFRNEWTAKLERNGIKVEVFLWDDFHDRFVHSNLLSMTWSNGFDTTTDPSARVTVSRLSRDDRDGLQMEFTENSTCHHLQKKFTIG